MKKILTFTFLTLAIAFSSFGQDTATHSQTFSEQDTVVFHKVSKTDNGYKVVEPKQSEWKVVIPVRAYTLQSNSDTTLYKMEQVPVLITDYQTEVKRIEYIQSNERLTYNQVRYLTSLPYVK